MDLSYRNSIISKTVTMNERIGVIVPVYKVEKYITECIDSILAQTHTNFRLILVDDGTPDNAGKICDEYAKKDPRITVIHQENAGVTRARARGVEEAEDCEFITFADADDLMPSNALKTLVSILKPDINIVMGALKRFRGDIVISKSETSARTKEISHQCYKKQMIIGKDSGPYCKLIRRSLITLGVFDIPQDIIMGEDTIANIRIAFNNKENVVTTTQCVYHYRQHDESIMHSFNGSPEYEELFFQHIEKSIPDIEKNKYAKYVVIGKILSYDYNFGYSCKKPKWTGSEFQRTLLKEIKAYKIRNYFIERQLITTTNCKMRKFLIILKRIKNKFFWNN